MAPIVSNIANMIAGPTEAERAAKRTRCFKTFQQPDEPDGRQRYRICGLNGPVHYRDDPFSVGEQFKEIDLDVVETPGQLWDAACETNGFQVRFWQSRSIGGKTVRYIAQFRRAGRWLAMAPVALFWVNGAGTRELLSTPQAVGAPTIDNVAHRVTWHDTFGTGIHFRYNLRPGHFFKTLIIDNKSDLPSPTIPLAGLKLTLVMTLSWHGNATAANGFAPDGTSDLEANAEIDNPDEELSEPGEFSYRDELMRSVWWLRRPRAWDSTAPRRKMMRPNWRLLRKGSKVFLLVSVPAGILNDPDVTCPVYIDTDIAEEEVGANGDDAEGVGNFNDQGTIGSWIDDQDANAFGNFEPTEGYESWMRWTTVPIPNGATINTASIDVQASSSFSGSMTAGIMFQNEDTATQIASVAVYNGMSWTTEVNWNPVPAMTANSSYTTPGLATPVGTVTARGGWSTGNALGAAIQRHGEDAYRVIYAHEHASGDPPQFNCNYTEAPPSGNPWWYYRRAAARRSN